MSNEKDIQIGNRLRARRKLLGLSQKNVAEAVGVTFQQVQKYERGVNRISASRLSQFAEVLHVTAAYFYEGLKDTEYSHESAPIPGLAEAASYYEADAFSSPETIELLKHFYRCPPNVRKQFTEMLKAMANNKATMD